MEINASVREGENPVRYDVELKEEDTVRGTYIVTATEAELAWGSGAPGEQLVEATFRFLLDREPPESILSEFSLSTVKKYFPEFPEKISDYF